MCVYVFCISSEIKFYCFGIVSLRFLLTRISERLLFLVVLQNRTLICELVLFCSI